MVTRCSFFLFDMSTFLKVLHHWQELYFENRLCADRLELIGYEIQLSPRWFDGRIQRRSFVRKTILDKEKFEKY